MPDREKYIEILSKAVKTVKEFNEDTPIKISLEFVEDILALLKEQETGHWIYLENCSNSGVYCSECHTKVFDNYPFKKKLSYFCPHCGTRMEGETERR